MAKKDKISIIIPCYNEEANLQKGVLDKVGNFVKDKPEITEVIIVDDGSEDDTPKIIKNQYLPKFKKFKYVRIPHQGKAGAVITGIQKAKGNIVLFSDMDLATPIEESEKLIKAIKKGYEIAIGSRDKKREGAPIIRKIMALGFILIRNFLLNLGKIKDTQCGFKAFERKPALEIISRMKVFNPKQRRKTKGASVTAGFDLELLFVAKLLDYRIKEIPVKWRHVETRNVNFIKDTLETLRDIAKIKWYQVKGEYRKNPKFQITNSK